MVKKAFDIISDIPSKLICFSDDLDGFMEDLVSQQYRRNDQAFERGSFRVRGDSLEVWPAHLENRSWRMSFFGDELEAITEFDPLTGQKTDSFEKVENFLKNEKIKFIRSKVGDRYVKEKMKKNNFNLGGEQSGHIILGKFATTGDGLLVALEVLFAIRKGKKASDFFNKFQKTPQILKNIAVKDKEIIKNIEVKKSIKIAEKLIKGQGRILVRKSGTESKIRVMAESNNKELLNNCINIISKRIK